MVEKLYESYKVWAQWLIRNLSQVHDNYHVIPSVQLAETDTDIFLHLQDKGVVTENIHQFYSQIKIRLAKLYDTYHILKTNQLKTIPLIHEINQHIEHELTFHNGKNVHVYRWGRTFIKYSSQVYDRLAKRYLGDPLSFKFYMFEMGFNYYILEGQSFQWCIPPKSLGVLEKTLSVDTELFASPINAVLPIYYSLFYVDQAFGSSGNFFNIDHNRLSVGTYEVNPPFIEQLFVASSKLICSVLQSSQQQDLDLLFIYIMPDWSDSGGYQLLIKSDYLLEEIVLKSNSHSYYHSMKNRLISANFETHILIIGTTRSKVRWTDLTKERFLSYFYSNYPNHPNYSNHPNHPNHPNYPNYPNHHSYNSI